MTDLDEMAPHRVAQRESRSLFRSWKIFAILLVLIAGVGGAAGYWYFALRKPAAASIAQAPEPEAPLPFYLEIKPFVVSVSSSAGTPHFVQLSSEPHPVRGGRGQCGLGGIAGTPGCNATNGARL